MNSVIQYIDNVEFNNIIKIIFAKNKKIKIVISDVPKFNRFKEFFLIPFFNLNNAFYIYSNIFQNCFQKSYFNLPYYFYSKKKIRRMINDLDLDLDLEFMNNYYISNTRYSLVIKAK